MNRRAFGALALTGTLAACGLPPGSVPGDTYWTVSLPPDAVQGAGDPPRAALTQVAYAFTTPSALEGNPAEAARSIANIEYLTIELRGPRWTTMPLASTQLTGARPEWREALGIAPAVPAQAVIDSLWAARRALLAGRPDAAAAALPATIYTPGGTGTLERLSHLPALPRTSAAAVLANREAIQMQDRAPSSRRSL